MGGRERLGRGKEISRGGTVQSKGEREIKEIEPGQKIEKDK